MTSQVIYARVPATLKNAADAYAAQRGQTLTGAVAELLDRGLNAAMDEQSIAHLQADLALANAERATAEAELAAAKSQLAVLGNLAQRARQTVGTCPSPTCEGEITGYDLLATGRCHTCNEALSGLLTPQPATSSLDQREMLILVGALGAVLGIAYLASK